MISNIPSINPNIPNPPNIPNLPNPPNPGPIVHPYVGTAIAVSSAVGGLGSFSTNAARDNRDTVSHKRQNNERLKEQTEAIAENHSNTDPEVRQEIAEDYLEMAGVTGVSPEEATAKLQKHGVLEDDQEVVREFHNLSTLLRTPVPIVGGASLKLIKKEATSSKEALKGEATSSKEALKEEATSSKEALEAGSSPPPEPFASTSLNQHCGSTLASISHQGSAPAPHTVLYETRISPSMQSYFFFYSIVAALSFAILPPFFRKTQIIIGSWLGLEKGNRNRNRLTKEEFDQVLQIIELHNKKSLKEKQARSLLVSLFLFEDQEIEALLEASS